MKVLFLVTTLIFISTSINALSCINTTTPLKISNNFTLNAVQNAVNELTLNEADDKDKCFAEVHFYYNQKYIEISFNPTPKLNELKTNRQVRVITTINIANDEKTLDPAEISNMVMFTCDTQDGCDRRFVLDHLQWLFEANYSQLESTIRPLLLANDDKTGSCIDYHEKAEENCSQGDCYAYYLFPANRSHGECRNKDNTSAQLHRINNIMLNENIYDDENENSQSNVKLDQMDWQMRYWCQQNNCNNQDTAQLVRKTMKDHYHLSALYKVLQIKFEEDVEEKTTFSTTTNSTITTEETNNISISVNSSQIMILFNVLFFFFLQFI